MTTVNPMDLCGQELSDRLRVGDMRGTGTYGWVYEGDLLSLGRSIGRCAVKVCQAREDDEVDNVLKEMRDCSRLLHPRLVLMQSAGIVRTGPAAGFLYVTTELAEQSLQDILDRGDLLSVEEATSMLEQICEALDYLHAQKLTHGEVRPANILRCAGGAWKLSGLEFRAALAEKLVELGPTEHLFVYRSPEVFEIDNPADRDDPSVDMWALGVVAHACLTGRLPFPETPGLSRGDMIWRIINRDPEPEDLPDPVDTLVRGCLKKLPDDRISAAKALRILRNLDPPERPPEPEEVFLPVEVAPPPPEALPAPSLSPSERRPLMVASALAMLALGLVVGLMFSKSPPKKRPNVLDGDLVPLHFEALRLDARGRGSLNPRDSMELVEDLGGVTLDLVEIEAGEFFMGTPVDEPKREADESPMHLVKLSKFYMSEHEITQAQWAEVAEMTPVTRELKLSPARTYDPDKPVVSVSYDEALEFCDRMTQHTGRLHRLPTEAEWEYACRGGTRTAFGFGPTLTTEVANFRGSRPYIPGTPEGEDRLAAAAVGSFPAVNQFGLYDMHGNVWEWCDDFYGPYSEAKAVDPTGPAEGYHHVLRGGGFRSFPWNCRCGARNHAHPEQRRTDLGFRVVVPSMIEESR